MTFEQQATRGPLRILLLEDLPTDAELVEYALRKEKLDFTALRVETREEFAGGLRDFAPDVILADYSLPRFSALDALRLLRAERISLPFILVTGATSEEVAVECMREGADDYILKTSLKRLPSALLNTLAKHRAEQERERAESALAEREHRFRALIENSSDVICILDRDGRVRYASPSSERILGYPPDDLLAAVVFDLVHPDDLARFLQAYDAVLQDPGSVRTVEFRVQHRDGTWRTLEGVARHVTDAPVRGVVLNSRDITERKKAEETSTAFSLLGQRLSSARTPAEAGRILGDATRELFGWHAFALDLYDPERDLVLPVLSIEAGEEEGTRVLPPRPPSPPPPVMRRTLHEGPQLLRRPGGTAPDGTGFLFPDLAPLPPSTMVVPIRNGERNIGLLSLQRRDAVPYTGEDLGTFQALGDHCGGAIERMKAAEALVESEERYRRFFEDDLTGDFIAAPDGRIIACNPAFARIFGFADAASAQRTSLAALYPGPGEFGGFVRSLRNREALAYDERELRRPDGRPVYVVQNAAGVFTASGELTEIRGYLFDDTERRTLQDQLRQIQKMDSIGTLASGIAHDFGNILNTILGFAGQLRKHAADSERILKYGDTIERSARRGADLAGQLLSFVRNKKQETSPTDLRAVIADVAALAEQTFPGAITVRTAVEENLLPVLGHRGELYQVLLNLSVNARDAMANGGSLLIEAANRLVGSEVSPRLLPAQTRRCVELRVTDTGTGIPEHLRARIFDPFFTTKDRGQGTGLGLSIVFGIVRSHKGSILVRSEVDRGSTFHVYLPAMESDEERSLPEAAAPVQQPGSLFVRRDGTILVADDDEASRDLTREILEQQGYRVVLAGDGVEAVRICAERGDEISVAVLDMAMPRMDGAEAYRKLAAMRPGFRAVFCTGAPDHPSLTPLLAEHRLRALAKPVPATALIAAVNEILAAGNGSGPSPAGRAGD